MSVHDVWTYAAHQTKELNKRCEIVQGCGPALHGDAMRGYARQALHCVETCAGGTHRMYVEPILSQETDLAREERRHRIRDGCYYHQAHGICSVCWGRRQSALASIDCIE